MHFFSEIGVLGKSDIALNLQSFCSPSGGISAFPEFCSGVNPGSVTACGRFGAENTKGRSLGERPAFLRSPPGCGVVEALGCVGRGLRRSGLGAAGGLGGTLVDAGALRLGSAAKLG